MKARGGRQTLSTITSYKMRSSGKIVPSVLAEYEAPVTLGRGMSELSSLEVIRRWREMSEFARKRARHEGRGRERHLWLRLAAGATEVSVAPNNYSWWRRLRADFDKDPNLSGLTVNRQHIRTTVLQIRLADAGLDVGAVALAASHGSERTTLRNYLNRGWFRSEMDELIRRFQRLFEAGVLSPSEDHHQRLGVADSALARRREQAVETGLGFACAHPSAPLAADGLSPTCTQLDACANCEMLRFVPTDTALQALVVTEMSLSAAESEFISRNPERWALCWLPMLALARAALGRLRESHRKGALAAAEARVEHDIAAGRLALVRPW